jgi:hypothetical protein
MGKCLDGCDTNIPACGLVAFPGNSEDRDGVAFRLTGLCDAKEVTLQPTEREVFVEDKNQVQGDSLRVVDSPYFIRFPEALGLTASRILNEQ